MCVIRVRLGIRVRSRQPATWERRYIRWPRFHRRARTFYSRCRLSRCLYGRGGAARLLPSALAAGRLRRNPSSLRIAACSGGYILFPEIAQKTVSCFPFLPKEPDGQVACPPGRITCAYFLVSSPAASWACIRRCISAKKGGTPSSPQRLCRWRAKRSW